MNIKNRCPSKGTMRILGVIFLTIITIICITISKSSKVDTTITETDITFEEIIFQEIAPIKMELPQLEPKVEQEPVYQYNITSQEREMLARVVFLEANTESIECQIAVISVIFNRLNSGYWGNTLHNVIYAPGQFTTAKNIPIATPTPNNYEAVDYVLINGSSLPEYVLYFRAGYHHKWTGYVGYDEIDNTYFGYLTKDKK